MEVLRHWMQQKEEVVLENAFLLDEDELDSPTAPPPSSQPVVDVAGLTACEMNFEYDAPSSIDWEPLSGYDDFRHDEHEFILSLKPQFPAEADPYPVYDVTASLLEI